MLKFWLLVAIGLSFFLTLGSLPLFDLDEGAFSEATREMLVSGDYLTTYLNGELRFDKPIFIYWFQALSVKLFGLNEFSVRLPSAIAGALWVLFTYLFTKRYGDKTQAFVAAFAMTAALQITIIAKAAIADALLNLYIALSMFALYRLYESRHTRYVYLTFLFVGLGTLTKGPVAIMIPMVVSLLFFALKGDVKFWLKSVFNPLGIMIFLAVTAPWYVLEYLEQGEKFINGFFFKHNLSRFSDAMEGHYGSYVYYLPVFLLGLLPFTSMHLKNVFSFSRIKGDDLHLFLMLWFAFVFIFFSFSGTKLPHYVIYGYTPLFIMIGLHFHQTAKAKWLSIPAMILYVLLILFGLFVLYGDVSKIHDAYAVAILAGSKGQFDVWYFMPLVLAVLFSLIMIGCACQVLHKFIAIGLVFIMILNFVVLPLVAHAQQSPIKSAALLAKKEHYRVIMWGINVPSFVFYSEMFVEKREPKVGEIVLMKSSALDSLKKYDMIYKNRGIALVKVIER